MKSTFKILFYVRKDKVNSEGFAPINARITIAGDVVQFSTKCMVNPKIWDTRNGKAMGRTHETEEVNEYLNNYSFIPIYDNNLDFFEKNIFLSEEDIKLSRLSKRHIFINQSINSNFFGSFTIMPDGKIHSNVNKPAIGSMSDEIYTLIEAE